jgi:nucleoside-diphosphate-sugar epimerase
VYGPTDNNYRVIQKFIESIFENKKLVANKPKSNRLDFTYVKDLVKGVKLAMLADLDNLEIFNLTRGEGRTLQDVIDILKQNLGEFDIEINDDNSFYPKRGALDISNAKNKLGYNPLFSLEDGIKDYISFLKS